MGKNGKTAQGRDDIFVRRFSFFNTYLGEGSEPTEHIQYLDDIILHVESSDKKLAHINTPILELRYRTRRIDAITPKHSELREAHVDVKVVQRPQPRIVRQRDGPVDHI